MKRLSTLALLSILLLSCLTAYGPAEVPPIVEVKPNETAFVVPLEGAAKSGQAQFMSLEYLQKNKLAAKRIEIPIRKRSTGRLPGDYEWIPLLQVIKVNRTPVTREWTASTTNGTSSKDEGFPVESADSIGFTLGATITTSVSEEDAALFLYRYAGQSLSVVTDTNIRSFIQGKLTNAFGQLSLTECKKQKGQVFNSVYEEARDQFSSYGVTINFFGPNEGLVYDNPKIQDAIDNAYAAEMLITQRKNEKEAQDEDNKRIKAAADTKLYEAQKFAAAEKAQEKMIALEIARIDAQANLERAQKWNGALPANMMPENSSWLMSVK